MNLIVQCVLFRYYEEETTTSSACILDCSLSIGMYFLPPPLELTSELQLPVKPNIHTLAMSQLGVSMLITSLSEVNLRILALNWSRERTSPPPPC